MKNTSTLNVLLATLPSYILVIVDASVVNVALDPISHTFGGNIQGLEWIVSSYTLVFGSLLLCGGYLGDRFGSRICYALGLIAFGVSSLLCGLSPSVSTLIAFRALQGAGAALLVPNSLALISVSFPAPADRSWAIGLWAGCGGIAMASGPLVGGALIHYFGWRSVFIINLPVVLAGLFFVARMKAVARPLIQSKFDLVGQTVAIAAIASTIGLLIEAPSLGWMSLRTTALAATALILWIALPLVERRRLNPMLPPALFVRRDFISGIYVTLISALTFYGFFFVLSLMLQRSMGFSPLDTGYRLLPLTISVGIGSLFANRVTSLIGKRNSVLVSLVLYSIGFLYLCVLHGTYDYNSIVFSFPLIGLAAGIITPATTVILMGAVEAQQSGITAGIQNTSRQVGAALGVAIFGIFLAQGSVSNAPLALASLLALGLAGTATLLWIAAFPRSRRASSTTQV